MERDKNKNKNINIEVEQNVAENTLDNVECEQTATTLANIQDPATNVSDENNERSEQTENAGEEKVEYVYKEMSPLRMVGRRFFRSKLSIVGLVMIVFLILFSFLGPVIYDKWGEETVDRTEVVVTVRNSYEYVNEEGETVVVKEVLQHTSNIN